MSGNSVCRKRNRNGEPVESVDSVLRSKDELHRYPALYSTDELAKQIRDECDYSVKINLDEAKKGLAPRKVRVYCDGIYDMFHSGHARQLMQVQIAVPNCHLIIGVCSDKLTHRMKGRTVMSDTERYEAVRHCRYVDELVTEAPWTIDDAYLLKHKIDFVAHDDLPYSASGSEDIYSKLKERGMFLATQRTEGISTTDVIARIIKDYDLYVRRNLGRGYSRKDLNVGFMKEKKIQFEMKVDKMKGHGKKLVDKWKENGNEMINRWEEKSKEFIGNFLDLFGRDGKISTWIQESKHKIGRAISPGPGEEGYEASSSPHHSHSSSVDSSSGPASPPFKRTRLDFSPSSSVSELDISDNEYEDEEIELNLP